jgi:hypothetical protein
MRRRTLWRCTAAVRRPAFALALCTRAMSTPSTKAANTLNHCGPGSGTTANRSNAMPCSAAPTKPRSFIPTAAAHALPPEAAAITANSRDVEPRPSTSTVDPGGTRHRGRTSRNARGAGTPGRCQLGSLPHRHGSLTPAGPPPVAAVDAPPAAVHPAQQPVVTALPRRDGEHRMDWNRGDWRWSRGFLGSASQRVRPGEELAYRCSNHSADRAAVQPELVR